MPCATSELPGRCHLHGPCRQLTMQLAAVGQFDPYFLLLARPSVVDSLRRDRHHTG